MSLQAFWLTVGLFYVNVCLTFSQQLLSNSRCNHWPDRGTCDKEFTVKWYYDRYDHRCRRFFYGGCDGNSNRFDSLEECSQQCHFNEPSNKDRCFQPHDPGHCNADIERWYFDENRKQCVCSWWSGCGGNSNIYYSYNHCMLICGDYAENGPGVDEKYWNRLNQKKHMSEEAQRVLQDPSAIIDETYSVQVPFDDVIRHQNSLADAHNIKTINISHNDDSPSGNNYLHKLPETFIRKHYKTDGVTIHRYDSEPRQLRVMEDHPRFREIRRKSPPRMIHLPRYTSNTYRIQAEGGGNQPTSYHAVKVDDRHAEIAESLQNEAIQTQQRIKQSLQQAYQNQPVSQPAVQNPHASYHPELVQQFRSHLEEHERSLREKLERQFPNHIITLTPQIETVRYPDGRSVVRQRIQWTAHPKTNAQLPARPPSNNIPEYKPEYKPQPVQTPAPVVHTTQSPDFVRIQHEEQMKKRREEYEKRRQEHERRREEHMRKMEEERQRALQERQRMEEERRRQYEETIRKQNEYKITTTPEPMTTIETTLETRTIIPTVTYPVPYPTIPVRDTIVNEADRRYPPATTRTPAEPIEHVRPVVEKITPAPLSIEDIIAIDNAKAEYDDDDYGVPMDFPDTEGPATMAPTIRAIPDTTTTTTTYPPTPAETTIAAIVLPPRPKSKLFAPISSEEYTQDVEFDKFVDFVM